MSENEAVKFSELLKLCGERTDVLCSILTDEGLFMFRPARLKSEPLLLKLSDTLWVKEKRKNQNKGAYKAVDPQSLEDFIDEIEEKEKEKDFYTETVEATHEVGVGTRKEYEEELEALNLKLIDWLTASIEKLLQLDQRSGLFNIDILTKQYPDLRRMPRFRFGCELNDLLRNRVSKKYGLWLVVEVKGKMWVLVQAASPEQSVRDQHWLTETGGLKLDLSDGPIKDEEV